MVMVTVAASPGMAYADGTSEPAAEPHAEAFDEDSTAVTGARAASRVAPAAAPPENPSAGNAQRALAFAFTSTGVATLTVGSYFGVRAIASWAQTRKSCPENVCPNDEEKRRTEGARSDADISTVLFIAGGASLAAGVVLWLTAPSFEKAKIRVGPLVSRGAAGLVLGGEL